MKKLHLGCGEIRLDDFINIDIRPEVNPDMCMDISDLSAFETNTIDYILAHDVLEHFSHTKVKDVFTEWVRCLKIGGQIEFQVPSIDRIYADRNEIINRHKGDSTTRFSRLIFGGQDYPSNYHFVCLTPEFFEFMAEKLNLKIVDYFPEVGLYNHKVILEKLK